MQRRLFSWDYQYRNYLLRSGNRSLDCHDFKSQFTLHPSRTLLFSGLPMMFWQKNLQRIFMFDNSESNWKNSWNQSMKRVTQMIWQHLLLRALSLEGVSNPKSSNHSGGQTHGWILLKKRVYSNTFCSICCRLSPFHREWLASTKIIMIWTFSQIANQNLSRLWPFEAIHGEKDLTCNKSSKKCWIDSFFQVDPSMRLASRLTWTLKICAHWWN